MSIRYFQLSCDLNIQIIAYGKFHKRNKYTKKKIHFLFVTLFLCFFAVLLGMMTHVQVSGTEHEVWIKKALTERSLKKLIKNLAKELEGEHSSLPHYVEAQIREEIANAGVAASQHGG
jgi:hypothetical protein